MSVSTFENKRWAEKPQSIEFRHREALTMIMNGTVLDVGCGDGLLLNMLKQKGISGEGLDISDEAVQRCEQKGLKAKKHSLDEPMPYADAAFDTVTLLDVLEHVYDPERLLAEAARVAKERLIVSVPNFSSLPARLQVMLGKVPENNRPSKGHIYWFNYGVLTNMAASPQLTYGRQSMNTFRPFTWLGRRGAFLAPNLLALSFVIELKKS